MYSSSGLRPRWSPAGLLKLGSERITSQDGRATTDVDIILVHGLGGDPFGTWTHTNGTYWPHELLPYTVARARRYVFGYDSAECFRGSTTIRDAAMHLLDSISREEYPGVRSNPIVFVCHSLGGVLVKKVRN